MHVKYLRTKDGLDVFLDTSTGREVIKLIPEVTFPDRKTVTFLPIAAGLLSRASS